MHVSTVLLKLWTSLNICMEERLERNIAKCQLWWHVFLSLILFYFWLPCVGFSLAPGEQGLFCSCGAWASHCSGWAQALGTFSSVAIARGLKVCGVWAQLFCGMWNLPRPGIEPVSSALQGGFLSTVSPGKSGMSCFVLFFDRASWHVGSQFPNQGLNLGHGSKSPESQPLGHQGTPHDGIFCKYFLLSFLYTLHF